MVPNPTLVQKNLLWVRSVTGVPRMLTPTVMSTHLSFNVDSLLHKSVPFIFYDTLFIFLED